MIDNKNITIVICCAGMGTRLGQGIPKALVAVNGEPLIIHQLKMLKEYDDIRVVVGFKGEDVVSVINKYRSDIKCYINYNYKETGAADSFIKGLEGGCRDYIIGIVGDILIKSKSIDALVAYEGECVATCKVSSENPIYTVVNSHQEVIDISSNKQSGTLEWVGLVKVSATHVDKTCRGALYQLIRPLLPLKSIEIEAKEIDTPNDLKKATLWLRNYN